MNLFIKDASVVDIEEIQSLARECYLPAYEGIHSTEQNIYMLKMMYSTESLLRQMQKEGSRYLILYIDNIPSAYAAFKPYNGNEHGEGSDEISYTGLPIVYLDKLYVLPEMKKKGLGRMLIERIVNDASADNSEGFILRLDVNWDNSAQRFYEHLGFKATRRWTAEIGHGYSMFATTMEKQYYRE